MSDGATLDAFVSEGGQPSATEDSVSSGVVVDEAMSITSRQGTLDAATAQPSAEPTGSVDAGAPESSEATPWSSATESSESAEPTATAEPTQTPEPSQSPEVSPSPEVSGSPEISGTPEPTVSPEATEPESADLAWWCPEPVSGVWAAAGNNSVTVSWDLPVNADEVELAAFYIQVASSGRVIRVDADATQVQVSGLRNGVEESFTVYAASEHGRSEASSQVSAIPSSGMEGEVAGLIVKFTDPAPIAAGEVNVPGKDKVTAVDLAVESKITDEVHLVELSEAVTTEQATEVATQLQSDPRVEWAEPDVFVFPSSTTVDDPQFDTQQWNLWDEFGLAAGASEPGAMFTAEAGAGTTVAVIDTGITSHPDLDSQLVAGYDFVSNPEELAAPRTAGGPDVDFDADGQPGRDADPTDPGDWREVAPVRNSTWHGTHIAGVIAAQAGNAEGIAGVAPGAKIQPIRALSWRGGLLSDVIASITWASGGNVEGAPANANPADVITMSFAANTRCSAAMQSAIDDANARGAILVAAAGNANDDVANYTPANCADVIAVAATGRDGKRAPYSNYGPGIDIAAPGGALTAGGGVHSTINTGTNTASAPGYASREGTSIAAAHVAGAIAHTHSTESDLSSNELRARFLTGEQTRTFPDNQCDTDPNINCGTGLLTLAQTTASLPAGVTITGGPDYTITLDCNAIPDGSTVYVGHQPGERLFTPSYLLCGQFLQVNRYVGELGGGGVALGFSGPSEIYPNSIFSSAKITIIYYRALLATGGGLDITPGTQTVNGTVGFPISTKALAADDFTDLPTYTVSPPLPSGLSFDEDTGVISGTPSAGQATTTYTITGTNGSEVATSQVNLTVYTYTVRFQPGNGASVSPTSIGVVSDGDSITLPTPTRTNYRFDGWFTASSGGTLVGQAGDAYVPTATVVLYAQWTAYRVTINRQGGSGSPSSLTVMPGDSIALPSQSNQSRLNFAGWYDSASGGILVGQPGDSYTPTGNVTIYAQWNATLSYSLGGGSMPNGESSTQVVNVNTTPSITLPTPTRSGYEFTGWYSSSTSGSKLGDGGGTFNVTENDTLYARWAVVATVTFDPGDYGQVVDDQRCTTDPNDVTRCQIEWRGSSLVLPDATSPTGLTFEGWWQNSSFFGSSLGVGGDTWSRTPYNATLYSRWSGTITFDPAGGSINTQSRTQRAGWTSVTEVPYRPGYAFEGWFDSDGSIALPRQNTSFTMTSTDTWTARWQQDPGAPEVVSAELVNDRETIRVEFSGDVQALYGDSFLCSSFSWESTPKENSFDTGFARQCSVTGNTVDITPTGSALPLTSTDLAIAYKGVGAASATDPTLLSPHSSDIAVAGATPNVTVNFDGNGGAAGRPSSSVPPNAPFTLPEASRSGLDFLGWFDAPSGGARVGGEGDSFSPSVSGTLYAQWQGTVEFSLGGAGTDPADAVVNVSGDPDTVLPAVTRAGFTFDGWFTEANGGERVGGGGDTYTVTANTTLHARWTAIPVVSEPSSPSEPENPPAAPPAFDQAPPRVELEVPVRPTPASPGSLIVDGVEQELVVERDEENVELDVTGEGFELTVSTSDTERTRITPTAQRTLVAPVRGFVEVNASGYAPESMVSLYLVPALSPRFSGRSSTDPYFLGMTSVDVNQAFADEFQLPDWALAGEYALQINGYRSTGEVKSINVRLDLIDKRADAVSVARGCIFPESSVRLTTECRQSLRSLKQVLPSSVDALTIEITGVAYAQGNKKKNRAVALDRAERVERFLERNDIVGDVTIDVVTRKGLVPGFAITPPPPVMVADSGKPATTVLMTVEWTTEIGPELALQQNG